MKEDIVQSEELLQREGYRQELDRVLSVFQTVGLALSDITPTASFFVIAAMVYPKAGTGAFWTFLAAGIIAMAVAASMAELGSVYPIAGGLYSIVARVLGKPLGFLAMTDYVVQAIFLPAAIALGIGSYMTMLIPSVNANIWATILMLLVTAVAVFRVKTNANITGLFLALELVVIVVVAILGFVHPVNSLATLMHPHIMDTKGIHPISLSVMVSAVAVALFSFNGYDSAINFSEETNGTAKNVGRSVINAAGLGVLFQVVASIAVLLGVDSLPKFFGSPLPIYYFVQSYLGTALANVIVVGVAIAVLNATLAIVLQFSRVIYSTARDQSWPGPINRFLGSVHPRLKTPWGAVLFVGLLGTLLTLFGSVVSAITFTSVMIIFLYALIAIAALVNRIRMRGTQPPFKMWLWPLPPLVALVGVVVALTQQTMHDLLTCLAIFAVGMGYYLVGTKRTSGLWRRGPESKPMMDVPAAE